ncbi:hypothetical protein [Haloarcula sp. CBA1127]|uniref:hypothetical protein n=1 Tax=Haloarcula sp. CBA1127 TaxID=1765055 RepID=UPI0018966B24|nr:hypothetical protein [Haloarcula sp. CBA1127]
MLAVKPESTEISITGERNRKKLDVSFPNPRERGLVEDPDFEVSVISKPSKSSEENPGIFEFSVTNTQDQPEIFRSVWTNTNYGWSNTIETEFKPKETIETKQYVRHNELGLETKETESYVLDYGEDPVEVSA